MSLRIGPGGSAWRNGPSVWIPQRPSRQLYCPAEAICVRSRLPGAVFGNNHAENDGHELNDDRVEKVAAAEME